MTIEPESRVAILAYLAKSMPGQSLGRTQLMKLLYFLQELQGVPLGYDFRLFNYGPFDSEVLSDLSSACGEGAVVEDTLIYPRGYGYSIKPGTKRDDASSALEKDFPDVVRKIDEVIRAFGAYGAAEMELRSTILFVDRELTDDGQRSTEGAIVRQVQQIKPHFDEPTILVRVADMNAKGYLQSIVPSIPASRAQNN